MANERTFYEEHHHRGLDGKFERKTGEDQKPNPPEIKDTIDDSDYSAKLKKYKTKLLKATSDKK